MQRKITPAERFRQELMGAVAGSQESFSGYCRLAAQAMLQTAMEVEATDFIGRSSYQRRQDDQGIYRNGYKRRRVATGEGSIALHVPQTRDGVEPFQTRILEAYRRRSETLEALIPQLYVKGLAHPHEVIDVRIRGAGGGRKPLTPTDPGLRQALDALVDPVTRGHPESPLRWTCKSTRQVAAELRRQNHPVTDRTVAALLKQAGYSLQANRKTREGSSPPDRNAQFEYLNRQVIACQKQRRPVVSVDTKKKEWVGEFKNAGQEWQPRGHRRAV